MEIDSARSAEFMVPSDWLSRSGVRDQARGQINLENIMSVGLPADLLAELLGQLQAGLRGSSDPDMALNHFERFFLAARSRIALAALIGRDHSVLPVLLTIFSTSHYLSELLIRDQEAFDVLRMTEGQPQQLQTLCDDINTVLAGVHDPAIAMRTLRRFRHREILRIAFGDLIERHRLGMVTEQISFLAEALCDAALRFADRQLRKKWGTPRDESGAEVPFAVLALGKLGGRELNYSSDIDLMTVFGAHGSCDGPRGRSCQDYFEELTRDMSRLLGENTPDGFAWRVDLRLRPDGQQGRLCLNAGSFLRYYEQKGRAWERQALIKCRPVAGDRTFGQKILDSLQPWIWRWFSHYDISAVKSLKRQIERRAITDGVDHRDVKTGHGGIRDIEFTTQFLQLLHGSRLPEVRHHNTLSALERLQRAGCLSFDEESILQHNYIWLRQLEHRLQIMSDLQTHRLPDQEAELERIARRMGYQELFGVPPLRQFRDDFEDVTAANRRILNHLLHSAFSGEESGEASEAVDLIYSAEVTPAQAAGALGPWGFADPLMAARQVQGLADERTPFLSAGRCRHFLAAVLPRLLREIASYPEPDRTLASLLGIADQLGGKGVLWELFHTHPATMQLFVRLCSGAGYLGGLLRSSPGMIDELIDALLVNQLPSRAWLEQDLAELLAGTTDPLPIIRSFRQAQHLRIGIQDLAGNGPIGDVGRALSDVADVCLGQIASFCLQQMTVRFGPPANGPDGRPCPAAIIACGKLGGRELNWQSDLDLLFLFESDGQTVHADPSRATSHQHFFSQWASEVTRCVTSPSSGGRLYEIDSRLRPTGKSGALATSTESLARYFQSAQGQSWERLALCKGRVAWSSGNQDFAQNALRSAILSVPWSPATVDEIRNMRQRLEQNADPEDLKRGPGGTVDAEFVAQLFQLKHLAGVPDLAGLGTAAAIQRIRDAHLLPADIADPLVESFLLLRRVESSLRLSDETPHSSLGNQPALAARVAGLMRLSSPEELLRQVREARQTIRQCYRDACETIQRS